MQNLLVIVPARGGSRRLPGKNIRELGGVPLIAWSIEAAHAAGLPTPVLSTDDPEIARIGSELGFRVPFLRPPALASDTASSAQVVMHALAEVSKLDNADYKVALLLQPTSPFRTSSLLSRICTEKATTGAPAVVAMRPSHVRLGSIYRDELGSLVSVFPGSDESTLEPSGAAYMVDRSSLEECGSFIPYGARFVAHSGISALDIDTIEDWQIAEAVLAAGQVRRHIQTSKTSTGPDCVL